MKHVYLVARIPKPSDLHLYKFSTNLYVFSKFAVLSSSIVCRLDTGTLVSFKWRSLVGFRVGEGLVAPFPARSGHGGMGKVGRKDEGLKPHLTVVVARREMDGVGLSTGTGGWRRCCPRQRLTGGNGAALLGRGASVGVGNLFGVQIWAMGRRSDGATVSSSSPASMAGGGGYACVQGRAALL